MTTKPGKSECLMENHRGKDRRAKMQLNLHSAKTDAKYQEKVVKKLAELFQDSFDLEIIQSVAQTCNWDCKYEFTVMKV